MSSDPTSTSDPSAPFLQAMQEHPDDPLRRVVFADWLEEQGDPRGELLRLLHTLTQSVEVPHRDRLEDRLRELVAAGVQPVGPFFTNSIGMKFAWIPAGTFLMGSPSEEEGREDREIPHQVTLTRGFYLAIHPVTQKAWQMVMGNQPSLFRGDDLPVETVSWENCLEFLRQMTAHDGLTYHLPTEAEWEYACRAGTTTPFHFGKACNGQQANCDGRAPYGTDTRGPRLGGKSLVGSYAPNPFGLHDMHGNVWEWCADQYGKYPNIAATDPRGSTKKTTHRVLRGGSWLHHPVACRAASRRWNPPATRGTDIGFRVAFRLG